MNNLVKLLPGMGVRSNHMHLLNLMLGTSLLHSLQKNLPRNKVVLRSTFHKSATKKAQAQALPR